MDGLPVLLVFAYPNTDSIQVSSAYCRSRIIAVMLCVCVCGTHSNSRLVSFQNVAETWRRDCFCTLCGFSLLSFMLHPLSCTTVSPPIYSPPAPSPPTVSDSSAAVVALAATALFLSSDRTGTVVDGGVRTVPDMTWQQFMEAHPQLLAAAGRHGRPARILFPMPDVGFDPTEAAVPWHTFTTLGADVVFATGSGEPSNGADPHILTGFLAGLMMKVAPQAAQWCTSFSVVRQFLPRPPDLCLYMCMLCMCVCLCICACVCPRPDNDMILSSAYKAPQTFAQASASFDAGDFDAIFLVGGHGGGMREYLHDKRVGALVRQFWDTRTPVGSICHGVLFVTRAPATDAADSMSLLSSSGFVTTSVPRWMERLGYVITSASMQVPSTYQLETTDQEYLQDEMSATCGGKCFDAGPLDLLAPLQLGSATSHAHAYATRDEFYVSARFFGDAYLVSQVFAELVASAAP